MTEISPEWISEVLKILARMAKDPNSPICDIEWLTHRCVDTLGYTGETRRASIKRLIIDVSEFAAEFPGTIPSNLIDGSAGHD